MKNKINKILAIITLVTFIPQFAFAANTHSADFDTTAIQYASVARATGINGGAMSMSLWIKVATAPENGGAQWYIAQHRDATNKIQNVIRYAQVSGVLSLNALRGKLGIANQQASANYTLTADTWFHVVYTYDGTTLIIYVNGTEIANGAASGNGSSATVDYFAIGTDGDAVGPFVDNGANRDIDAELDEVLFFNANIGATRASNLYTDPCNPDLTNAISQYSLDNVWTDAVGGFTLTAGSGGNAPTFSTDPAFSCDGATPPDQQGDFIEFSVIKHESFYQLT